MVIISVRSVSCIFDDPSAHGSENWCGYNPLSNGFVPRNPFPVMMTELFYWKRVMLRCGYHFSF